ncbi:MAG TPA: hypothetical protein VGJ38_06780 [Jatrophihabitantaceae bacterium]|jgi:hypothetical protein
MAQIPTPLRAALGLMANAIEGARTLPDKAVELPVMAVSTALQFSLRAQQRYAELTLRGDELLSRLHGLPEEPPEWATFDDEAVSAKPAAPSAQPAPPPTSAAKQPRARKAAPAKKTAAAKKAAATKKTAAAKKTAAKAKTTKRTGAKTVRAKRSAEPSAFDAVGDASAALGTSAG